MILDPFRLRKMLSAIDFWRVAEMRYKEIRRGKTAEELLTAFSNRKQWASELSPFSRWKYILIYISELFLINCDIFKEEYSRDKIKISRRKGQID